MLPLRLIFLSLLIFLALAYLPADPRVFLTVQLVVALAVLYEVYGAKTHEGYSVGVLELLYFAFLCYCFISSLL